MAPCSQTTLVRFLFLAVVASAGCAMPVEGTSGGWTNAEGSGEPDSGSAGGGVTSGGTAATDGSAPASGGTSGGGVTSGTTSGMHPDATTLSTSTADTGVATGEPTPEPSSSDEGSIFLPGDTGAENLECSVWEQDCASGEKCNAWAHDGGNGWNATRCTPVAPEPDGPGESCTVEGNGASGIDSCIAGAICMNVDSRTNRGTCVSYCDGSPAAPSCADSSVSCVITNEGVLPVCVPVCDPLAQDCGDGLGCYGTEDTFICIPTAVADGGQRAPCQHVNECAEGFTCVQAGLLSQCSSTVGCCAAFCDLDHPWCSGGASDCVEWFEGDEAPDDWEDVGICL